MTVITSERGITMKVFELISVMDLCDYVEIHGIDSLEWGDENPYTFSAQKVRDIPWILMEKIGKREIESVGIYERVTESGCYLSIRYS